MKIYFIDKMRIKQIWSAMLKSSKLFIDRLISHRDIQISQTSVLKYSRKFYKCSFVYFVLLSHELSQASIVKQILKQFFFAFSGSYLYWGLEIIDLSAQRVLLDHLFVHLKYHLGAEKCPYQRAAKLRIMVPSCNVENCKDTLAIMVGKGEIQKKGRTYCVAGAPNDVSYIISYYTS